MTTKKHPAGQATMDNILLASRQCFAKKGFFDTSMQDIETAAQTSRGSIYHHFASKDEIIKTIISQNLGAAALQTEAALHKLEHQKDGDLGEILVSALELVEQITFGPGRAMSLHVWSFAMIKPDIKELLMQAFEKIRLLLKKQLAQLQLAGHYSPAADLDKLSTALFAVQIPAYIMQRLYSGDNSMTPQVFTDAMIELFHNADKA